MPANISSIALITKYSVENYDKIYKADATASILAPAANMVQFTGAKTVRVAKISFGGLNDHTRNNFGDPRVLSNTDAAGNVIEGAPSDPYFHWGYQPSGSSLEWEDFTLTQDRSAEYDIGQFDDEESGGQLMGNAISEITRHTFVPEIDAYVWAKVYQSAGKVDTINMLMDEHQNILPAGTAKTEGNFLAPLATLNRGLQWESDHEVPDNDQIILMAPAYLTLLRNSRELTKFMLQGDWNKNVSFSMTKYEGRDLIIVPPERFQTNYTFFSFGGHGFRPAKKTDVTNVAQRVMKPGEDGELIDFIIMPKTAAAHVVKFQKVRIISGDAATALTRDDGYAILARVYHDVIVYDNKRVAIYAHKGAVAIGGTWDNGAKAGTTFEYIMARAIAAKSGNSYKIKTTFTMPADRPVKFYLYTGAATITNGTTRVVAAADEAGNIPVTDIVPMGPGDVVADGAKYIVVDRSNTVVANGTVEKE